MRARLTPAQLERLVEIDRARKLAARGLTSAARVILARYGLAHVVVEVNQTVAIRG